MSWIKTIFKGGIDIGDTVNNLLSKVDDSKFTVQEKAAYNKQLADSTMEFYKLTLNENTVRSKTRRKIAILLIKNYLFIFWIFVLLWLISIFTKFDINLNQYLEIIKTFQIVTGFLMILAFFFGGYYAQKFKK